MNIQSAIAKIVLQEHLTRDEMQSVMRQIMTGECTDSQIGGLLIALRMKGESVDEITAAAEVMSSLAEKVNVDLPNLIDSRASNVSAHLDSASDCLARNSFIA